MVSALVFYRSGNVVSVTATFLGLRRAARGGRWASREALGATTNMRRLARGSHLHSHAEAIFKGLCLRFNLLVTTRA